MSLNFDFTAMIERLGKEEYDRITDHPVHINTWHPVTDALIWACMGIGMPGITEKNLDEFVERLNALQAVNGPCLQSQAGPIYITREDVYRHIGLSTNVSKESKTSFYAKLFRMAVEEGARSGRLQKMSAFEKCNNPEG